MEALANSSCGWFYRTASNQFESIPGTPVVYWLCNQLIDAFASYPPLESYACPKKGLGTDNKELFMRYWWEPSRTSISFDCKDRAEALASCKRWFPHNKGGSFRWWFGNNDYVVDWSNDGASIKEYTNDLGQFGARPQNQDHYFKACITWSKISSGRLAFRYKDAGSIFNEVAPALFSDEETMIKLEAFLNSSVCHEIARAISPTLDFQVGQVATYPVAPGVLTIDVTTNCVRENTEMSRIDWNAFEESWGFRRHPLV